jgi:hypothetical protein
MPNESKCNLQAFRGRTGRWRSRTLTGSRATPAVERARYGYAVLTQNGYEKVAFEYQDYRKKKKS